MAEHLCQRRKPMAENLERNEGLRILARIIAKAYLADNEHGVRGTKTLKKGKKDERISGTSRNRLDGKRGK